MNCSSLITKQSTTIPAPVRRWLAKRLQGPARGPRALRRKACIFALGRIGDFVLTLSALRLLLQEIGPAGCMLVVPTMLDPLVAAEFPGVERVNLPAAGPGLLRDIVPLWLTKRSKFGPYAFERLICLSHHREVYYETVLSWINAEHQVRLTPDTYPPEHGDYACTELLAHQKIVERALGRRIPYASILPQLTHLAVNRGPHLLVYPLSCGPERCLPVDLVTDVLHRWRTRNPGTPIIFGGSGSEAPVLARYVAQARAAGLGQISVETPPGIDGFVRHIAQAGALLASESAAAHVAAALDQRTVVVMPASIYGYCQPWGNPQRQRVLLLTAPPEEIAAALPDGDFRITA